ncbi:MAG TPA: helix-turn-helix domain-containing protein [Nocardioidaceae bacterium]|nr:helix-turn-helix domain-containing protein [Nocardioidaceae bacterium]
MSSPDEAPRGRPEAIVRPRAGAEVFTVERIAPSAALARFVDYHWLVRWDVPSTHRQQVVPQPRVHVAAEQGRLLVHGVSRKPFERVLTGRGLVLGAAFHPAGFRPLLGRSVGSTAGTVLPGAEVLGIDDRPTAATILADGTAAELVHAMEAYLLATAPEPDETARWVDDLVAEAERRRDIRRAEQLAAHAGVSLRSLQRAFTEYVGIGPKWVIQRFRILEAAAAALAETPVDWAALAQELGFSDQAHLTRAFTQVVGTPPATYRRDPGT